jgi:hypothetical protein
MNNLQVIADLTVLESQCVNTLQPSNWHFNPEAIFREERQRMENALTSTEPVQFLTLFPGKVFLPIAAQFLDLEPSAYRKLVNKALVAKDNSDLAGLRKQLETTLSDYLPPR